MGWDLDRASFDRLVLEHLDACQRLAVRLTGDPESAEDVVQDAMVRAARGWKTFRGEARFQTWLFRIVINAWRDRKTSGHAEPLPEIEDHCPNGPIDQLAGKEIGQVVAHAVSQLPPRQREVIILIVYEQMTICEAAAALEVSEGNVRTNLHYGRERLREKLRAFLPEEQPRERQ